MQEKGYLISTGYLGFVPDRQKPIEFAIESEHREYLEEEETDE